MKQTLRVYVGTYTEPIRFGTGKILEGKGEGIYLYEMDPSTGAMSARGITTGVVNPSYLAFGPGNRFLYAVNELKSYEGQASGSISAFAVDGKSGALALLNRQPTLGTDPCHVTVDPAGGHVLVANFMSGSVCVLPIRADGSLAAASDFVQHQGSSVDPARQSGPHAHAVTLDPAGRFAFVPDLGIDRVVVYRYQSAQGKLLPEESAWVRAKPGAGPRHLVFHPDGRKAYLINELNSTLAAYRYDPADGMLQEIHSVPTLPPGFSGSSTCADVHVSPDGRFLFGSNRGHDSLVIYGIDPADGRLAYVGHCPSGGRTPRNFALDPAGRFAIVANQDTDTIVTFGIDPRSGELGEAIQVTPVPTPVCVKVVAA